MKTAIPTLLLTLTLLACGGGSSSRFYDGAGGGMGRDSLRLELRPDGQWIIISWEGNSSAGTYVETGESIIFTHPQGSQQSGKWLEDGSLKVDGRILVPVDADKPMPKRR